MSKCVLISVGVIHMSKFKLGTVVSYGLLSQESNHLCHNSAMLLCINLGWESYTCRNCELIYLSVNLNHKLSSVLLSALILV